MPSTLFREQKLIEKLFCQSLISDIIQNIAVTGATNKSTATSLYRTSLNVCYSPWSSKSSLKIISLRPEFTGAENAENSAPLYSARIRILVKKVFHNNIIRMHTVW